VEIFLLCVALILLIGLIVVAVLVHKEYDERFRRLEKNPQFATWMGERDVEIKQFTARLGDAEARLKVLDQRTSRSRPEAIVSPLAGNYIDTRPRGGAHRWRDEGRDEAPAVIEVIGPIEVEIDSPADEGKKEA
jgi:hypothetical protein